MKEKKDRILIKKRLVWYCVAGITAILNYYFFYFSAQLLGSKNPGFIAFMFISAVFAHETMHLIAFELNGIPAKMFFLLIIGGTVEFKEYKEALKSLAWEKHSIIVMAGVFGNFLVIAASFFVFRTGLMRFSEFLAIVNLNSVLILYNLIPLWPFDGGYFAKMFFNSMPKNRNNDYQISITASFIGILIITLFITGSLELISFLLIPFALYVRARKNNTFGPQNPNAIPVSRQKWWAAIYLILISVSAIIVANTTSWVFLIK